MDVWLDGAWRKCFQRNNAALARATAGVEVVVAS
jgi:hypothetical protein